MTRALLVIDMQHAFDDLDFWGPTTNPRCQANVAAHKEAADQARRLRIAVKGQFPGIYGDFDALTTWVDRGNGSKTK